MRGERQLISWLRDRAAGQGEGLVRAIGDDCAVFKVPAGGQLLVTTDTLVQGVHFDLAWHPPALLGRKAVAVNLSDIAAMGGRPLYALLNLMVPADCREQLLEQLLTGITAAAAEAATLLIGGDTVRSMNGLCLTLTVIGTSVNGVCFRDGARPGDQVWVSGGLGLAAAGLALCRQGVTLAEQQWREALLAHLAPRPQLDLGQLLATSARVHAMMDLSDGLATDLAHLCAESGVGAEVAAAALPIPPLVVAAAQRCGASALEWSLTGGEDYQLLFTCPPEAGPFLARRAQQELGSSLRPVGRIVAGSGVVLCLEDGRRREISYQGYDHFQGQGFRS